MRFPRLPVDVQPNAVARAVAALHRQRTSFVDLTASNPTSAGFAYPDDLLRPLGDSRGLRYEPQPFGLRDARVAVARDCARRGLEIQPRHVVLTTSTSESYSWLFKLLCAPGDRVLVPRPSYPLFEHLTALEGVHAAPYELDYHGRWTMDFATLERAVDDVRAVLIVSPNNPTGSYVSSAELQRLTTLCRDRRWALIADEVFADYTLDADTPVTDIAARADVLAFTLGGASKSLGLPQVKLGWIVAGGPDAERDAALAGLELIADTYLSVSTPVQVAAADLLRHGAAVRDRIHQRVRTNLAQARAAAQEVPACEVLRAEGGWSAVIRVPATRTEERLVLDLLEHEQILVHPGYFFDFPTEAYLVVSLLVPENIFAGAVTRMLRFAAS